MPSPGLRQFVVLHGIRDIDKVYVSTSKNTRPKRAGTWARAAKSVIGPLGLVDRRNGNESCQTSTHEYVGSLFIRKP